MPLMTIGDAAAAAGVTPKMIRHYESLGLVPEAERTEAGYRLYGPGDLAVLRFIRHSRSLGFSMQQIGTLVAFRADPARRSADVKQLAQLQLDALLERQRELDQMRTSLEQMVMQCRGDGEAHCGILEGLAGAAAVAGPNHAPCGKKRGLDRVHPRVLASKRPPRDEAATASAHSALADWTRSFAQPSHAARSAPGSATG